MKKNYLTIAGLIAALILAGMFIAICLSATPFPFLPAVTNIDPVTEQNVDENNIMILTGTTGFPENTYNVSLKITAIPGSLHEGDQTGWTDTTCHSLIISGNSGNNRWKGVCDISDLQPADYRITIQTFELTENFTRIEHDPLATGYFSLADAQAGPDIIYKKAPAVQPFIRINSPGRSPLDGTVGISGITNNLPGTALAWSLQAVTGGSGNSTREDQGTTQVITGIDGVNRWYVPLPGDREPGRYRFLIGTGPDESGTAGKSLTAESEINAPALPSASQNETGTLPVPYRYIAIDALPHIRTDGKYILTGTTNLPAGNGLQVQVYPDSFETNFNFTFDARKSEQDVSLAGAVFSGATGGVDIVKGSGDENLWSFRLETYHMSPGQYRVNVSNDCYDRTNATVIPGDLFSSNVFAITD